MYSPKIKEDLVIKLYQLAKANKMRMTVLVDELLRKSLKKMENKKANKDLTKLMLDQ